MMMTLHLACSLNPESMSVSLFLSKVGVNTAGLYIYILAYKNIERSRVKIKCNKYI